MACQSKSYPLAQAEVVQICAFIKSESGIEIDPTEPTGSTTTHGCTIGWTIDPTSITINIISKPFYISCDTIFGELDKLFTTTVKE